MIARIESTENVQNESVVPCSEQPLRFREVYRIGTLDIKRGEYCPNDSVSESWIFANTEAELQRQIEKVPIDERWSVRIRRCRVDQFGREYLLLPEHEKMDLSQIQWSMHHIDVAEGEQRHFNNVGGSGRTFKSLKEAEEYVDTIVPAEFRWSVTITPVLVDELGQETFLPLPGSVRYPSAVADVAGVFAVVQSCLNMLAAA